MVDRGFNKQLWWETCLLWFNLLLILSCCCCTETLADLMPLDWCCCLSFLSILVGRQKLSCKLPSPPNPIWHPTLPHSELECSPSLTTMLSLPIISLQFLFSLKVHILSSHVASCVGQGWGMEVASFTICLLVLSFVYKNYTLKCYFGHLKRLVLYHDYLNISLNILWQCQFNIL